MPTNNSKVISRRESVTLGKLPISEPRKFPNVCPSPTSTGKGETSRFYIAESDSEEINYSGSMSRGATGLTSYGHEAERAEDVYELLHVLPKDRFLIVGN